MKLKDLIQNNSWKELELKFKGLYPEDIGNLEGFKKVYNALATLQPIKTDFQIVLSERNNDEETFINVNGKDKSGDNYGLDFIKWEEWLEMEVDFQTLEDYENLDIVVHCLWEMTFHGYDQEQIQEKCNELEEIAGEIEKNDNVIPLDKSFMEEIKELVED